MSRRLIAGVATAALLAVGYTTPTTPQAQAASHQAGSVQISEELMLQNGKLVAGKKIVKHRKVKKARWKPKPTASMSSSPTPTSTGSFTSPTVSPTSSPTTTTTTSPSPTSSTTTSTTSPSPTATYPADWQPSVAPSGDATHYSFIATGPDGKPVRWNPCAMPITWRINSTYGPSNSYDLAAEALNRVAAATGFTFKYLGTTTVMPYASTNNTNPADTMLVVAFGTPTQVSNLTGNVVGLGGPAYAWTSSGSAKITSAQVLIDASDIAPVGFLKNGFQQGASVGSVLLHETGHAMGLNHYNDTVQIMNPGIGSTSNAWYMNGDLGGLSYINSKQTCFNW